MMCFERWVCLGRKRYWADGMYSAGIVQNRKHSSKKRSKIKALLVLVRSLARFTLDLLYKSGIITGSSPVPEPILHPCIIGTLHVLGNPISSSVSMTKRLPLLAMQDESSQS
jgi:hypothetical protein